MLQCIVYTSEVSVSLHLMQCVCVCVGGGGGGGGVTGCPWDSQKCHDSTLQVPLHFPLQLRWRRGSDMPLEMGAYIQSVVVQGKVYVGGGRTGGRYGDTVMVYDISSGKWANLPPYRAANFAMTVINNQLVLVGGQEHGVYNKVLGVWRAESKEWTHPYPDLSTARSWCSAVVYNGWLVVAGGDGNSMRLLVEVMNTVTKQWYAVPPTPTPWTEMKAAIVGDTCYFMGGFTGIVPATAATTVVYSVSLPALISQLYSQGSGKKGKQQQIWKEIPGLQTTLSTPLSISGSLLAVGGRGKDKKAVTAIHLYQPDTGEWMKVVDLPTPRYWCTCAVIADREMLVAGGRENIDYLCRSDMALINVP